MPKLRRYRPPRPERKLEPIFARPKERREAFFAGSGQRITGEALQLQVARIQALQSLDTLGATLQASEGSRSKALEWAQQTLAADMPAASVLQTVISRVSDTIRYQAFVCHHQVEGAMEAIPLGNNFHHLNPSEQAFAWLKTAVAYTSLPERSGLPIGRFEHTDPALAWAELLTTLIQLLPDCPLLITGTPIAYHKQIETPATPIPEDERERNPFAFFRRLFGRQTDQNPQ